MPTRLARSLPVLLLATTAFVFLAAPNQAQQDPGSFTSPEMSPGGSWNMTFQAEAVYDYHCHPHPWMTGAVRIVEDTDGTTRTHTVRIVEPEGEDSESWRFEPTDLEVEVGDTVVWRNEGAVMHQVMGFRTSSGDTHVHSHGDHGAETTSEEASAIPAVVALAAIAVALAASRRRSH